MTCIVGVEFKDCSVIAGDVLGSNGHTGSIIQQPKIFEHSDMVFGYTTTFRFGQVLECMLDDNTLYPPESKEGNYKWLVRNFIPKLKNTLENEGCQCGEALICINSEIWVLQSDYSVLRNESGISSVGSGEHYAIASLSALFKLNKKLRKFNEKTLDIVYDTISESVVSVSRKYNYIKIQKT